MPQIGNSSYLLCIDFHFIINLCRLNRCSVSIDISICATLCQYENTLFDSSNSISESYVGKLSDKSLLKWKSFCWAEASSNILIKCDVDSDCASVVEESTCSQALGGYCTCPAGFTFSTDVSRCLKGFAAITENKSILIIVNCNLYYFAF